GHVAKTRRLGTGVNIGIALLEQVLPGSSAITPLAGKLIVNRYTQTEEYAADRHGADILQRAGYSRGLMDDPLPWRVHWECGCSRESLAPPPATEERIQALNRDRSPPRRRTYGDGKLRQPRHPDTGHAAPCRRARRVLRAADDGGSARPRAGADRRGRRLDR